MRLDTPIKQGVFKDSDMKKINKLRQFSYCEKLMKTVSLPISGGSYTQKDIEITRKVGFKVGSTVCDNETTVSSIESKRDSGMLIVDVFVCDKDNSEAKWKTITVTNNNVCVEEFDWKNVIKCRSER